MTGGPDNMECKTAQTDGLPAYKEWLVKALAITGIAGLVTIVAAHGQMSTIVSSNKPKVETRIDASGDFPTPDGKAGMLRCFARADTVSMARRARKE